MNKLKQQTPPDCRSIKVSSACEGKYEGIACLLSTKQGQQEPDWAAAAVVVVAPEPSLDAGTTDGKPEEK